MRETEKNWPAWYYGPDNAADVFDSADDVPAGWTDHPSKVGTEDGGVAADKLTSTTDPEPDDAPPEAVDKSGWAWDATRNTANQAQTQSGLWQLLPGQSRPAPKPGYPKEAKQYDL